MVRIFLDDCRKEPEGWLRAKTARECLELLRQHRGDVEMLSLDHDLEHSGDPEEHGYWMVKEAVDRGLYANVIYFHSANQVGRDNMFYYWLNGLENEMIPDHVQIRRNTFPPGYTGELDDDKKPW